MFPENLGAKAFRWAIGKPAGIKIVRSAAAWNISWGGPQKMQKSEFFASFASPRKFCEEKFYQDRTMRKLTSRAFRKCVTYWACEVLNGSYRPSKTDESEKTGPSSKLRGVTKKDTATIVNFELCHGISVEPTILGPRWFRDRPQNWKLWPCLFFVTPPLLWIFSSIFTRLWQPITLV